MPQNTGTPILTDRLKIDSPKDPSENVPQSTDWIVQPKIEWHTIQSGKPMSLHTRNENTSELNVKIIEGQTGSLIAKGSNKVTPETHLDCPTDRALRSQRRSLFVAEKNRLFT